MNASAPAPAHHLGRSNSTIVNDNAATKFYNTYRRVMNKVGTFDGMQEVEIEGDNLQNTIAELVDFVCTNPIPSRYVGDFRPPASTENSDEPIPVIKASVLVGYVGKVVKLLHFKFPHHEDFEDLDII